MLRWCSSRRYLALGATSLLRSASARTWAPFSAQDEAELVKVIKTKPRHVLKHVRQQVWRSRKKEIQFRNTVTQLMIVVQDFLRKQLLDPQHASTIMEGVLEECVKHGQHDMAHLLFRALLRFRKYGCTITLDALRFLFESYKENDSSELMLQIANEMKAGGDVTMRPFCIAAYLFAGKIEEAEMLFQSVPMANLTVNDIVAIVQGFVLHGKTQSIVDMLGKLTELPDKTPKDFAPVYKAALRGFHKKNNADGFQAVLNTALTQRMPLDPETFTTILRHKVRLASSADDIVAIESELKAIGYIPDATGNSVVIAGYARLLHFGDKGSEEVMLAKVDTLLSSIEVRLKQPDPDMDISGAHLRAVIRGYGAAGRPELIKSAWKRMQHKSISNETRVYNELLKWFSVMGNVRDVLELKEEMAQNAVNLDATSYAWVFRALGKYYPRQFEICYQEMVGKHIRPDIGLYTTLVGIFGDLKETVRVEEIVSEVHKREDAGTIQVNPTFYAVLIRIYSKDLSRVSQLFAEATKKNVGEHPHVQTAVLHAYSSSPDGKDLLETYLGSLKEWTVDTYNVVINMYGKNGQPDKVEALFEKMKADKVPMNDVTFGTLVTSFARSKNSAKIHEVIEFMKEKEGQVSASFYAVLAASMARMGDKAGINDAWDDLLSSKLFPNTDVYNQFLSLYGRDNNIGKVRGVLDSMMKVVPPNPVTATTVLDMLGKTGRILEMEQLLEDMKGNVDTQPTSVTYHQVLNAYAKSGDVFKMEKTLDDMHTKGMQENHVTFNILADGYGRAKRFEQVKDVLARRKAANIPMDDFSYCVVISAFGKAKLIGEVEKLIVQIKEEASATRKVLWVIVDAYCRVKDVAKIDLWIGEIAALSGGTLSIGDKMTLIPYFCRLGAMDRVDQVIAELDSGAPSTQDTSVPTPKAADDVAADGAPPQATPPPLSRLLSYNALNAIAKGYARVGRFEDTVRILHGMRDRHLVPDSSTTLTLSSAFLKAGLHEQARQVVQWRQQYADAGGDEGADEKPTI